MTWTRRRRRWLVAAALLVVLAVYGSLAAARLLAADHRLRAGEAAALGVRARLHDGGLTSGRAAVPLATAAADFAAARDEVAAAWLAPLRHLPVVGRQLASVEALATAAAETATAGHDGLARASAIVSAPHADPAARAALIGQLASVTAGLRDRIDAVRLGPVRGLLPVLAAKHDTFARDLGQLETGLRRAAGASAAAARLLEGPSTYLVLAANNAEMRDGSGMVLQVGTVSFDHGSLHPGPFLPASALLTGQPAVPVGGDVAARWGFGDLGKEWRNLALSPQFPLNAPIAADMWEARTHQRVDGVLSLDVAGLADLLDATGPVTVGSTTYRSATVVHQLLVDQYGGLQSGPANDARQQALGTLAVTTLAGLQHAGTSVDALARALDAAANGRHLLLWDRDPAVEAGWVAAGVDGTVPPGGVLLGLLNEGANKLDPWMRLRSTMVVGRSANGAGSTVGIDVVVTNTAPTWLSPYAGDGTPGPRLVYNGAVAFDVPGYAGHVRTSGGTFVQTAGADGPTAEVASLVHVAPGASTTVHVGFDLLGRHGQLRVMPSARVPATGWVTPSGTMTDDTAHWVRW